MTRRAPTVRDLVARLGPHPASGLGLDLATAGGRGRWWVAALVLGSGAPEEAALRAVGHLARSGLAAPDALAAVEADRLAPLLGEIGRNRLGPLAARLVRSSRALAAAGSEEPSAALDAIASRSAGLEELGTRLVRLSPGVGSATVLRFLQPLRDVWASAADVPLAPSARTAALHLGWLDEHADPLVEPALLRERRDEETDAPPLPDVEAALERLGARACRRGRPDRCPLAEACPRS